MKVGPLDLPVSNAMQLVGFALLVVVVLFVLAKTPVPAKLGLYAPAAK